MRSKEVPLVVGLYSDSCLEIPSCKWTSTSALIYAKATQNSTKSRTLPKKLTSKKRYQTEVQVHIYIYVYTQTKLFSETGADSQ